MKIKQRLINNGNIISKQNISGELKIYETCFYLESKGTDKQIVTIRAACSDVLNKKSLD